MKALAIDKMNIKANTIMYFLISMYFLLIYCISGTIFSYRALLLGVVGTLIFIFQFIVMKKRIYIDGIGLSIIIILCIMIFSSLINRDSMHLQAIQNFMQIGLFYLAIVSFCDDEKKNNRICTIIFWIGFIGGPIAGIYQMITGSYIFPLPIDSVYENNTLIKTVISSALQYNANLVALQFVSTLFIGIYLYKKNTQSKILFVAIIITFSTVLLTFSRTTIIATIISLIFYCLLSNKKISYSKLIIINFSIIIFIILLYFKFDDVLMSILGKEDIQNIVKLKGPENVDIRYGQWMAIKDTILSSNLTNIIFGYGYNYPVILGNITGYSISAHNTIFEMLIKNGVISCILLGYTYYKSIRVYWTTTKYNKDFNALLCGTIAVLITLQMISAFSIDSIIYLMFASIILRNKREEKRDEFETRNV